jgi:hypothetical protein
MIRILRKVTEVSERKAIACMIFFWIVIPLTLSLKDAEAGEIIPLFLGVLGVAAFYVIWFWLMERKNG